MLDHIFTNACIMITLVTIGYHYIKNLSWPELPFTSKILLGLYGGMAGIVLMLYSVRVEPTVIIDFRNFAVIVVAIFGNPLATFTAALIIAFYRIFFVGISTAAFIATGSILLLSLSAVLISKSNLSFTRKWIGCTIANLFIGTVALTSILFGTHSYWKNIFYFQIGTLLISLFLHYLLLFYIKFDKMHNRLKSESTKDFLTGVNNVRSFDIEFNRVINHITRKSEKLSFLMLDIDHFKKVNDTYGHAAGDDVLRQLSNLMVEVCRDFDIISRNGGEEFSVILQDCPSIHAAEVAERIRQAVEVFEFKIDENKNSICVTVSIGVATYPEHTENPEDILKLADKALYMAKINGRNRVVVYDSSINI